MQMAGDDSEAIASMIEEVGGNRFRIQYCVSLVIALLC